MPLLKTCPACLKKRFILKYRTFYSQPLKQKITTVNKICKDCLKVYKSVK